MATIANKGWYYTPHLVDSIEGATEEEERDLHRIRRVGRPGFESENTEIRELVPQMRLN